MDIEQLLEALRIDTALAPNITAWRTVEARPARYGETPEWLDARLQAALAAQGVTRLYTHQAQALEAAARGENVVVVTGTASGKSLCYHLPALQACLEDPEATVLYLYPTKALAHDQEAALGELCGGLCPPYPPVPPAAESPLNQVQRRSFAGGLAPLHPPPGACGPRTPAQDHFEERADVRSNSSLRYDPPARQDNRTASPRDQAGPPFHPPATCPPASAQADVRPQAPRKADFSRPGSTWMPTDNSCAAGLGDQPHAPFHSPAIWQLEMGRCGGPGGATPRRGGPGGWPPGKENQPAGGYPGAAPRHSPPGGRRGESPPCVVASYDGDTPSSARPRIRREARLLLTNPDMLHAGILPRHPQWERFFANLRYVVIDELHVYRGLFGSHVANVLRRLRRVCTFYGSAPRFLCASATIANPAELAGRLLEAPATVVDDDGAPRGRTHLVLYNPPLVDPRLGLRRSLLLEAQEMAQRFLAAGLPTVVFARTRQGMELLLTYLRKAVGRARAIRGYRGGYLPKVRREIESGLRDGRVQGVVATNALELGVDIGTLDAAVLAGYPGTIASTWQQAGRAGRREAPGAAVLVAGPGPLDQYLAAHPDYFFGRSPEHALVNPDNPLLLLAHLRCAAYELAFRRGESFGTAPVDGYLDYLAAEGSLMAQGDRFYWIAPGSPAAQVSLRTAAADPVVIVDVSGERPAALGQVDRPSAPVTVYEGAIYLHEGRFYQVERLDWAGGVAAVRPAAVDHYTRAGLDVEWEVVQEVAQAPLGGAVRAQGDVRIHAQATAYRKVRLYTHETLGWGAINLPPQEYLTQGCWLVLPALAQELLLPDYGPNWPAQRRRARARDGCTCRHCGAREAQTGREHDVHHRTPFRRFGYVPGENDAYLQANDLDNLVTLCRACHARVDHGPREGPVAALQGLGHLLHAVAPLYLMCDPGDIHVSTRLRQPPEGLPVVLIYDGCPGGAGLSPHLYEHTAALLAAALARARECPCAEGCPSCVGPMEEGAGAVKAQVVGVLEML